MERKTCVTHDRANIAQSPVNSVYITVVENGLNTRVILQQSHLGAKMQTMIIADANLTLTKTSELSKHELLNYWGKHKCIKIKSNFMLKIGCYCICMFEGAQSEKCTL